MIKSEEDIQNIKKSALILSNFFEFIVPHIKEGISTYELDKLAYEFITKHSAIPSFLNYQGFPGSICSSINEVVIHGIPSKKDILKEGDVIGIDCGVNLNGYFSDSACTFPVGKIKDEVTKLLKDAKESLYLGIDKIKVGGRISDISKAVSSKCSKYGVVENYCGHGVGLEVHEDPEIPNNYSPTRHSARIKKGMVLAIEPMINLGKKEVKVASNKWSVITADKKPSAHFEHTVAITEDGVEILTTSFSRD